MSPSAAGLITRRRLTDSGAGAGRCGSTAPSNRPSVLIVAERNEPRVSMLVVVERTRRSPTIGRSTSSVNDLPGAVELPLPPLLRSIAMASLEDLGEIAARLEALFGRPAWAPDLDPLSELISTVIGQQTVGPAARRAFEQLRRVFPTWEEVRRADVEQIAAVIADAGLGRLKALRIKGILETIAHECGELRLDFLAALPADDALIWLQRLPGVGPTTAACTLLFGLNRPAFPVDTGIHRTALRLGLAPPGTSAGRLQAMLAGAVPPEDVYATHVNLIRFSREFCTSSNPACPICPLNDLCASFGRYHPQHPAQARSLTKPQPRGDSVGRMSFSGRSATRPQPRGKSQARLRT